MSDASDDPERTEGALAADDSGDGQSAESSDVPAAEESAGDRPEGETEEDLEALRREVEEKYDFEDFGPADMAEMTGEEWEAAFDPETWITGEALLDRVEDELNQRVADRDVFARIERREGRIVAYSDTGYATVYADGSVEGRGTVLRDVKPTVALCSMEEYDPPENPPEGKLPEPQEVPEGSGQLGNWMLQAVAGVQVLAGLALVGAWLLMTVGLLSTPAGASVRSLNVIGMLVAGILFLAIGILLFIVVANARLSDRFRAEEYRNRLRAIGVEPGEHPDVLPEEQRRALAEGDGAAVDDDSESTTGGGGNGRDEATTGNDTLDASEADATETDRAVDEDVPGGA